MNTLISLVISFVLLLSGAPALPATPETIHTVTISDFSLNVGEDEFATDAELSFGCAPCANGIVLTADAIGSDGTTVPFALSIGGEGIRLTFNDMSNVYMLDSAMIEEAAGLDEETVSMIVSQISVFEPIASFIGSLNDPAKLTAFAGDLFNAILSAGTVSTEAIETDVEGIHMTGNEIKMQLTPNGILTAIETLRNGSNAELTEALNLILSMIGAQSFDQLASEEASAGIPIVMCITADDNGENSCITLALDTVGIEGAPQFSAEFVSINGAVKVSYEMTMKENEGSNSVVYNYTAAIVPTDEAETYDVAAECHMEIGQEGFSEEVHSEPVQAITSADMSISGKIVGELCSMNCDMVISQKNGENEQLAIGMKMDLTQEPSGENGVATAINFNIEGIPEINTVGMSVKIAKDAVEYEDMFTGDVISIDEDSLSNGTVQLKLASDVLGTASDLLNVLSDVLPEGFDMNDLMEMFSGPKYGSDGPTAVIEDVETDEVDETVLCESFEEAAKVFGRALPEITEPEGYSLDSIMASEGNVYAYYYDAEGNYIGVVVNVTVPEDVPDELVFTDYGDEGTTFEAMAPYGEDCYIEVFFPDMTQAEAQELIASMGIE